MSVLVVNRASQQPPEVVRLRSLPFLRAVLTLAWAALRNPFRPVWVSLETGREIDAALAEPKA